MEIDITEMKFSSNAKEGSWNVAIIQSEHPEYDSVDEKHYLKEDQTHLKIRSSISSNDRLKTRVDTSKLSNKYPEEFKIAQSLGHYKETHDLTEKPVTGSTDTCYTCPTCKNVFTKFANVKTHMLRHKPVSFECKICKKTFVTKRGMKKHMFIHEKRESYVCDICSRVFTCKSNLCDHIKRHMDVRPHKCKICGKGFIFASFCKIHMRTHTGERPFECDICKKRFSHRSNMKSHILINMQVGRHRKCPVCLQRFSTSEDLQSHVKIHYPDEVSENEVSRPMHVKYYKLFPNYRKKFACEICSKVFLRKSSLDAHINTKINFLKAKPYFECKMCKQKFCHSRTLAAHEKVQHYAPPISMTRSDEGEIDFQPTNFQKGNLKTYKRNKNLREKMQSNEMVVKTEPDSENFVLCSLKKEPEDRLDLRCEKSHDERERKMRGMLESGSNASNFNSTSIKGEIDVHHTNFPRVHLKTYERKKNIGKKVKSGHISENQFAYTSVVEIVSVMKTEPESDVEDKEVINCAHEQQGNGKATESENCISSFVKEELDLAGSENLILFPSVKNETSEILYLNYETEICDVKPEFKEGGN